MHNATELRIDFGGAYANARSRTKDTGTSIFSTSPVHNNEFFSETKAREREKKDMPIDTMSKVKRRGKGGREGKGRGEEVLFQHAPKLVDLVSLQRMRCRPFRGRSIIHGSRTVRDGGFRWLHSDARPATTGARVGADAPIVPRHCWSIKDTG